MVQLTIKSPTSEPIAPNQDTVRELHTSAPGMQDLARSLNYAEQVLEDIQKERIYSQASAFIYDIFESCG